MNERNNMQQINENFASNEKLQFATPYYYKEMQIKIKSIFLHYSTCIFIFARRSQRIFEIDTQPLYWLSSFD